MTEKQIEKELETLVTLTKQELINIVTSFAAEKLELYNDDGTIDVESLEDLRVEAFNNSIGMLEIMYDHRENEKNKYFC